MGSENVCEREGVPGCFAGFRRMFWHVGMRFVGFLVGVYMRDVRRLWERDLEFEASLIAF